MGKERAEGVFGEEGWVSGEDQEFMLGGMGEAMPRKAKEENEIEKNARNCPVTKNIFVINFECEKVSIYCKQ